MVSYAYIGGNMKVSVLFGLMFSLSLALVSELPGDTVAYWNFDDGAAGQPMNNSGVAGQVGTYDLSGNGYDMHAYDPTYGPYFSSEGDTPSGLGLSGSFNGSQDGYTTNTEINSWEADVWTIEFSFKMDSVAGYRTFIGRDGWTNGSSGDAIDQDAALYLQYHAGANLFRMNFATVSQERYRLDTTFTPEAGQWYNIVVTCDGSYVNIYKDANDGDGFVSVGSFDLDDSSNGDNISAGNDHSFMATGNWTFGRGWWSGDFKDHIVGGLDEIRFSDTVVAESDWLMYCPVSISETDGRTFLYKTDTTYVDSYSIVLSKEPTTEVSVIVDVPVGLDGGNGNGQPVTVVFDAGNWAMPVDIDLAIADSGYTFGEYEIVSHTVSSADSDFDGKSVPDVKVSVYDDSCGVWGYLSSDYNFDCLINLKDFALLASLWMAAEKPFAMDGFAGDWLDSTLVYDDEVYGRSFQDSDSPFYVDTANVVNTVDPFVYGQFYEHIYHSANGGLWGEMVWNRSFEMNNGSGSGVWSVENGNELVQSSGSTNVILNFGAQGWSDYEVVMEAMKDGGSEGFLIEFRSDDYDYYWLNLGGWGNTMHAVEKAVNGSRSNIATQDGSINSGQWYTLRIRCEGDNISVWIDEDQVFDITDASVHATGYLGVGTWSTQARYRNITVTDLSDSSTLFSGLPALPYTANIADFWSMYGGASAVWNSSDSLNDDYCVSVDSQAGNSGLIQGDMKFISQQYSGSLWLKGSVPAGVKVELLDDGLSVIGEAQLGAPGSEWSEYSFEITPSVATDNGYMRINLNGAGSLLVDQVSMMGQDAIDTGGYRPDLLEAVQGLRAPIIRWPGGCYASAYFWKDGIGEQVDRHKYAIYLWEDQDSNTYGTDEFLRMCEANDIEPLLVINCGILDITCGVSIPYKLSAEEYMQDALDWMEYCNGDVSTEWGAVRAANGHPEPYNVEYWEIDNETWVAGDTAYANLAVDYAIALRAKAEELNFPIKLIACGGGSPTVSGWNTTIVNTCAAYVDYISVHWYESPSNFKSGTVTYENFLVDLGNLIDNSANPDLKIYMSEWNAQSIDWRTGMYCGGLLNVFERQGEHFRLGGPALFLRHVSASDWNNAFINFDHTGYFVAPNYIVMKLWWDHYAPNRLELTVGDNNLNTVATLSEDGETVYLKIVNPDAEDKSVSFELDSGFLPGQCYMEYVAPGSTSAANSLADKDNVHVEARVIGVDGQFIHFEMPGYSVGVITVRKQ